MIRRTFVEASATWGKWLVIACVILMIAATVSKLTVPLTTWTWPVVAFPLLLYVGVYKLAQEKNRSGLGWLFSILVFPLGALTLLFIPEIKLPSP
jgi:hypothetical protein